VSSFHEAGEPYQRGALHLPAVGGRITCAFERNQVKNSLAYFDSRYFRSKRLPATALAKDQNPPCNLSSRTQSRTTASWLPAHRSVGP
jgi:hypothetical protein